MWNVHLPITPGALIDDATLRRFKKALIMTGTLKAARRHDYYIKPGERKRLKSKIARSKIRKARRRIDAAIERSDIRRFGAA